jgi:hypothetical protein
MAIWQDLISDHGFAGSYQTNPHARSPSVVQRIGPIIAVRNFWWELSKQRAIRAPTFPEVHPQNQISLAGRILVIGR